MDLDFEPFFKKYEKIVALAEEVFERVKKEYPDCVKCEVGCSDCCHALFDLTLIEALYLNFHVNKKFAGEERERLQEQANQADRKIYKIKKEAYRASQAGKSEDEILADLANERVRCPLLNAKEKCDLYEHRPITCRLYGIPTSIGGRGHTCGLSGFAEGERYPTVNLDIIQKQLYDISAELAQELNTRYSRLAEILVPLSMALLTVYDNEYLGISDKNKQDED